MAPFYPLTPAARSGLRRHDGGPPNGGGRVRVRDTTSWRHPARAYLPEVDR